MRISIFFLFSVICLVGCQQQSSEQKVRFKLQAEAKACQKKQPLTDACHETLSKFMWMAETSMRLQSNPQQFGQDVLALQTKISELESATDKQAKDEKVIKQLKYKLAKLIEIIAIYESPNS